MVLLDIYMRLQSLEKSLQDYGLPTPISEELAQVEQIVSVLPAVICEVMDFDIGELKNTVAERQLSLQSNLKSSILCLMLLGMKLLFWPSLMQEGMWQDISSECYPCSH